MNEFHFHLDEGKRFFDLACGETDWKYWSDKDKRALLKKPDIIRAIDLENEDVARIIAIDRVIKYTKMDEEDEDCIPSSWNNLSEVLHFISKYVRENTPDRFDEHVNLFREQTDGMFTIEYTEEEFA